MNSLSVFLVYFNLTFSLERHWDLLDLNNTEGRPVKCFYVPWTSESLALAPALGSRTSEKAVTHGSWTPETRCMEFGGVGGRQ